MLWILIGISVGVCVFGAFFDDERVIFSGLIGFLIAAMLAGSCVLLFFQDERESIDREIQGETLKLVALQDGSQTEGKGHFSWSGGGFVIATNEVYLYYYTTGDGGYRQGKVNAEDATIYEEKNCKQPRLISYDSVCHVKQRYSKTQVIWRMILLFLGQKETTETFTQENVRYEIYVPEGTVLQNFNLDAK